MVSRVFQVFSAGRGSAFRRNTIHVLRANVIAQGVVLLSTPLLSRLYSPDDFGQFAFFSAAVAIAVSVSTGRFDWSIPNARTASAAATLVQIGLLFVIGTTLLGVLMLVVVTDKPILVRSGLGASVFLLPPAMLGAAIVELFHGWFVRRGNLQTISHAKIAQGLSNTGISIVTGLAAFGASGLMLAVIVSAWIGIVIFAKNAIGLWRQLFRISAVRILAMFKRFGREARLSTAVSLINALSSSASVFMIARFFSLQELGWYALMLRLALAPIGLVSSAIGQSFWSAAAELARARRLPELRTLYLRTIRRLSLLALPIAVGCMSGPFIIGPLFGSEEWGPAGYVLLAMAPHLIGTAIFSPTNHLVVYRRQAYQLASDILAIALVATSIYVSAWLELGIVVCTFFVSLSMLVGYVLRFVLHLRANTELSHAA